MEPIQGYVNETISVRRRAYLHVPFFTLLFKRAWIEYTTAFSPTRFATDDKFNMKGRQKTK